MTPKLIVHVAEVEIREDSGMGRIAWHWRDAFRRRGHEFVHIGPSAVGPIAHPGLFPYKAWQAYKRLGRRADVCLVHEPAAGPFVRKSVSTAVFSHGLERRAWRERVASPAVTGGPVSLKTRVLFPIWRLRHCDAGIRYADRLLLTNSVDTAFAQAHYGRQGQDVFLFHNGADPVPLASTDEPDAFTVLFNASWIARKGIDTLARAATILHERSVPVRWVLAGTQVDAPAVLQAWPAALHPATQVIPSFPRHDERTLLAGASLFVLPSIFEGQPLSLLQAMAAARCCIATDSCGQRDLVQDGHNGLLFGVGDAARLAELMALCHADAAMRRRLGEAAQGSVRDRLWATVADDVAERVLAVA
jgi:glycosyltransferase involved in cell wall biosynthesis